MRVGIVSDIHCQEDALRKAIAAMGRIDRLVCLGDAINQASFCNETVGLLRQDDALAILGNHEEAFFEGPGRSRAHVDEGLADWLSQRPHRIETMLGDLHALVVHSTPWPSNHAYVPHAHRDFHRFAVPGFDVVLYGHTHQPLVCRLRDTLVINPGSVGEGRPTLHGFVRSCAVLDTAARAAEIIDLD
jgi:putative phosphoesterase